MLFSNVSVQEQIDFLKSLALMLKSGTTLNESLKTLAGQARTRRFKKILHEALKDVETGTSLSSALGREETVFGKVFLGLIRSGEASGTLDTNLDFLADLIDQNNNLRKDINNALLYPKIVLTATVVLGSFLAVVILPRLIPFFTSLNIELPLPTKVLLWLSSFIAGFWELTIVGALVLGGALYALMRVYIVKRGLHYVYLKLPYFGALLKDYELLLISRLLYILTKSGMSITEVLSLTAEALPNIRYKEAMYHINERVATGTTIAQTMYEYPQFFPQNFVSIIETGEKSGKLQETLSYLTSFYQQQISNKIKKLPVVIEPLLLIVISLVVGFIALAIIMPIYGLTGGLNR